MGSSFGIYYPDFEEETLKKLRSMLPSFCTPGNPLDMTAALCYDSDLYAEGLKTVMAVSYTHLSCGKTAGTP